jgi:hypothetical protein
MLHHGGGGGVRQQCCCGDDDARRLCGDDARLAAVVRHDARLEWTLGTQPEDCDRRQLTLPFPSEGSFVAEERFASGTQATLASGFGVAFVPLT